MRKLKNFIFGDSLDPGSSNNASVTRIPAPLALAGYTATRDALHDSRSALYPPSRAL